MVVAITRYGMATLKAIIVFKNVNAMRTLVIGLLLTYTLEP